ncbi:hypothetical protein Tco_1505679 [Tanacetum coccineum]
MAVPRMPYEQLAEFLEEKYGCYFQGLYYQVPSQDLEKGLVRVSDDRSTSYMFNVEETFGRLNLYLDHLDMKLSEYLSQAITYDMDDFVSKKIGPPKKRYCNDFSIDEMVDWAEMEVETDVVKARASTTKGVEARNSTTDGVEARNSFSRLDLYLLMAVGKKTKEGVEARTRTKDKGKEKVSEDASDIVETRRCTVEVDTEIEYESDDDDDYQSDKLVDYLSPGEDELIELRNMMKANRKEKAKAKDKSYSGMNEPNEENSIAVDNVRGETFEEHDIYMNELLKSLKTADKDGITEDPFISVGEKSGEERVVAKCGQRPPRVSAPEKGKQRKHTKYPCASSDALPKCPWRCYARWMTAEKTFQCISLVDEHTCVRNFNFSALVNYKWIAKIFGDKIRANPSIRLCDIADLVMKKYKCKVHCKVGSDCDPDGKPYFDRFYVCFAGLADGWKAVVNVENKDNWTWFLELLEEDLDCSRGNGLTLMSDQHKLLWAASKASYPQLFNKIMDKIKSANLNAHKFLMDNNPKSWSRAFFVVDRGCESIKNRFSEYFNSVIVNVRHKPLLIMLEAIRVIVLERMNKIREISMKWNPGVCPNIKKRVECDSGRCTIKNKP